MAMPSGSAMPSTGSGDGMGDMPGMGGSAPAGASTQLAPSTPTTPGYTSTDSYGPYLIPPASGDQPGELPNLPSMFISKPCSNCFVTHAVPTMQFVGGKTANLDSGVMMHHVVFAKLGGHDYTCPLPQLGAGSIGQRFWAAGNEREAFDLPAGYGLPVGGEQWYSLADLMNMTSSWQVVYIKVTWTWLPSSANLRPVTPLWLDAAGCNTFDTFSLPAGTHTQSSSWTSDVGGKVVFIGGHMHPGGVDVKAVDETTGKTLCDNAPVYNPDPRFYEMGMPSIADDTVCEGDVGRISAGDTILVTATYAGDMPADDVMGIMRTYVDTSG
jgi:hypothetical protein